MANRTRIGFSLCVLCVLGGESAFAGTPRLQRVNPPGRPQGTTVEVEFVGRGLDRPQEVLFYGPGITVESLAPAQTTTGPTGKPQPVEPGTRVRARLTVAADCPLGLHGLRLRTAGGLSEYQRFAVGPFPTVEENEVPGRSRNDTRESAVAVAPNTTVLGRLNDPTDVDLYRVDVRRGQRLSADIEAARLGVERGIPDLHLAFYDAAGKKLAAADDSALYVQDPVLSSLADRDGRTSSRSGKARSTRPTTSTGCTSARSPGPPALTPPAARPARN